MHCHQEGLVSLVTWVICESAVLIDSVTLGRRDLPHLTISPALTTRDPGSEPICG